MPPSSPFPLEVEEEGLEPAATSVLLRYRVQRLQRWCRRQALLSEAVSSLNALAEAQAARPLAPRAPNKILSIADPVAASMHSRIARRVAFGVGKPVEVPEGKKLSRRF